MEKTKFSLIVAPIVVSIICIVLAVNAGVLASQLNRERSKAAAFNPQIIDLEKQLSDIRGRYDEQTRIVRDLQSSLDAARRETATLRTDNSDLEARLRELQLPSGTTEGAPAAE